MSFAPQPRALNFDEQIGKLKAELAELHTQLANSRPGLKAIWNETRGTLRDIAHTTVLILLSR